MSRLDRMDSSSFTGEQLELYSEIINGPRNKNFSGKLLDELGSLTGPFDIMMRSPRLGKHLSRLGEALRFESSLASHYVEFLILKVAVQWKCEYEWYIHFDVAKSVGLEPATIESIRLGEVPDSSDIGILVLDKVSNEILGERKVSNSTFMQCREIFTESEMIQIATLLGYYTLLAIWLNLFEVKTGTGVKFFGND